MVKYIPKNRAFHRAYTLNPDGGVTWYGPVRTTRMQAREDLKAHTEANKLPLYHTMGVAHILDKPSYFPDSCFDLVI